MVKLVIIYHSRTGITRAMAEAVARGAKAVGGVNTVLKKAEEATVNDLTTADGVAFGSPTYFAYMAGALKILFENTWSSRSKIVGKPFAAFTSGSGDEAKSLQSIENLSTSFGLKKACPGLTVTGMPSARQIEMCVSLGAYLAWVTKKRAFEGSP